MVCGVLVDALRLPGRWTDAKAFHPGTFDSATAELAGCTVALRLCSATLGEFGGECVLLSKWQSEDSVVRVVGLACWVEGGACTVAVSRMRLHVVFSCLQALYPCVNWAL
ncbi:hypothetical protein ERJ75_000488900 [Trypanosoma vivax]|nr:hypothetical protein ERJ75_000488900 [Trypanosoma vivax]